MEGWRHTWIPLVQTTVQEWHKRPRKQPVLAKGTDKSMHRGKHRRAYKKPGKTHLCLLLFEIKQKQNETHVISSSNFKPICLIITTVIIKR